MGKSVKNGLDSFLVLKSISSGKPFTPDTINSPTFSALLGTPRVVNQNGLPMYEFANNKVDEDFKYLTVPIRTGGGTVTNVPRANQTNARVGQTPAIGDTLEVQTALAMTPYDLTYTFQNETSGKHWEAYGSAEQWLADQIAELYVNNTSAAFYNTLANGIPGDGVLGSFCSQITDGLTAVARGFGPDHSTLNNFLNTSRTAPYRSFVLNGGAGAFTPAMGRNMSLNLQAKGAKRGYILAPMSIARYAAFVESLYSAYGKYELNDDQRTKLNLGGNEAVMVDGVVYYPDPFHPAGQTYQLFINGPSVYIGSSFRNPDIRRGMDTSKLLVDAFDTIWKHQMVVAEPWRCGVIFNLNAL